MPQLNLFNICAYPKTKYTDLMCFLTDWSMRLRFAAGQVKHCDSKDFKTNKFLKKNGADVSYVFGNIN